MGSPIDSRQSSNPSLPLLETSMSTLIIWNVSKVVEKNPHIDLRRALKEAQERLERDANDINAIVSQTPEARHLACALLAWQHLGHNETDSLYRFIMTKQNDDENSYSGRSSLNKDTNNLSREESSKAQSSNMFKEPKRSSLFNTYAQIGPVVKLPTTEKKTIKRSDTPTAVYVCSQTTKKPKESQMLSKLNEACCLESACAERLSALDGATKELRTRAAKLAKREAERVQLLERAETAWRDLELGYQRRLTLAEEKETDLARQTQKVIEERNRLKSVCLSLTPRLKALGETAEKARERLTQLEKSVCDRACVRLRLMEEAAKETSIFSVNQCQASQLDRDLQFKEEQARRRVVVLESEVDSLRGLTHETERALRSELGALRDQVARVSKQLLAEDGDNCRIKEELEELRKEKNEIVEDLEGCKLVCDERMQAKVDELRKLRAQLGELEAVELQCRCHLPVDAAVAVHRTPSLAALCRCTPEDKVLDSCSCTSLRSRLLSTMLSDLFGGLQLELGNVGAEMPCQLLKCLEDKHNWDRASVVKSNLRNFFSKLLVGELDIAIASSIEKYHAKWIGASCADSVKMLPDLSDIEGEGWQRRAIEREAQRLAGELAEQMFEEKAEQLAQRAKDIAAARGPPPCECNKSSQALYPCILQQRVLKRRRSPVFNESSSPTSSYSVGASSPRDWHLTPHDVTLLRTEMEHLKKGSGIKKEDIKLMEQEIAKIVQLAANQDTEKEFIATEKSKKDNKNRRYANPISKQNANQNKLNPIKKKQPDVNYSKNANRASQYACRNYKRPGQSYAVNVCLCSSKDPKKIIIQQQNKVLSSMMSKESKVSWKQKSPDDDLLPQKSSLKHTKPVIQLPSQVSSNLRHSKYSAQVSCKSDCACFHKVPSNTSIDELLKTLAKWNHDITGSDRNIPEKDCLKFTNPEVTDVGETTNNISTTNSKPSKQTLKEDSKPKIKSSLDLSTNETVVVKKSSQMDENVTSVTEFERQLPTAAESQYMGAINLDKSNENFCKCIIDHQKISDIPIKCMNSCSCPMKCLESEDKLGDSQNNIKNKTQTEKEKKYLRTRDSKVNKKEDQNITSLNKTSNQLETEQIYKTSLFSMNPVVTNSGHSDQPTEINTGTKKCYKNKKQNTSDSDSREHDRDYHIEFLGVTLTNASLNDVNIKDKIREIKFNSNNYHSSNNENINSSELSEKCNDDLKLENYQPNVESKIFDFASIKQHGDFNSNKDIALDTQSLKESNLNEHEPCICCYANGEEESKDLEVNTFHLLEEHLKQKLEDLKLSCTTSCISPDVEGKLYSALVKKIKHIITDNTSKVICKCSEEYPTEGSWNRAYNLLQEYLKLKLNRVQCMCESPTESKRNILPEVTNKVYSLIENDFQRLKDIYKCENVHSSMQNIRCLEQSKFQVPEKDTNLFDEEVIVIGNDTKKEKAYDSKSHTSIILTQTISSQVTPIFVMETKSCDAIEHSFKCLQTPEQKLLTDKSFNSTEPNNLLLGMNKPFPELPDVKTREVNQFIEVLKTKNDSSFLLKDMIDPLYVELETKSSLHQGLLNVDNVNEVVESNNIAALPYIGYTVNCSCNHNLGKCVCTKAKIQENKARIKNIWDAFNKPLNQKFSYIMNTINKKNIKMNVGEICEITNGLSKTEGSQTKNNLCDINTNTYIDEHGILLKDSSIKKYQIVKDNTTNTFDDDMVILETDYNTDNCHEWYECRYQPEQRVAKFKSVHFPVDSAEECVKKETIIDHHTNLRRSLSGGCECNVVPICHVKMLMDDIEKKIVRSECTCDSFSSKVCPVHSQRSIH